MNIYIFVSTIRHLEIPEVSTELGKSFNVFMLLPWPGTVRG